MDSGLSKFGFRRKTYNEILEDMEARAKELFGESVNLSERSPLGMFLQTIAWELTFNRTTVECKGQRLSKKKHMNKLK